jgi:Ca2+-binding EF-hand superfamily protein
LSKRGTLITVVAVCILALAATAVMAQDGGDGKISKDEFQGPENMFARIDANGDGVITQDEIGGMKGRGGAPGEPGGRRGAGDPEQRWKKMLENWDANNDGQISKDEFQGPEQVFKILDRDGDGVITEQEGKQGGERRGDPEQRWKMLLERWDADGDGQLSREEFQGPDQVFDVLDADGDGVITQEEHAQAQQRRGQRPDPATSLIQMMDEDGDGRVSQVEWMAFFAGADADGDGFMTLDELTGQMKKMARPEGPAGGAPGGPDNVPAP